MDTSETQTQKRIVNQLSFGSKTAKRVTWEAWEFQVVGRGQIEVTNASYGCEKDEHRYVVRVEETDGGLFVPGKCECPADEYGEDYACKHRVATATIGGPVLLGAAMAYTDADADPPLVTDGGKRPDGCTCHPGWHDDAPPCWPCYRSGFKKPNPDTADE